MSLRDTLHALMVVQQIDTQTLRAQKTLAGLDTGAQAAADAEAARQAREAAVAALHKAAGEVKDGELKQSAVETKQKSYQQKLYQGAVTNAKELANIEKEIAALGRQRADMDGRILEAMERAETAQAEAERAEAAEKDAEARRESILNAYQSRRAALQAELAELARQRKDAVVLVDDPALLKRYEDLRAKPGGVGLAKIENGVCSACHMSLPAGVVRAVKDETAPQICENCRRLLTD